eukprot:ANDGO_00183.mRNA.2 hypothetical protein
MFDSADAPDERDRKERARSEWLAGLEEQIKEKERRKRLDSQKEREYEERKYAESMSFNPYGKPGGGAPLRDYTDEPATDLARARKEQKISSRSEGAGKRSQPVVTQEDVLPELKGGKPRKPGLTIRKKDGGGPSTAANSAEQELLTQQLEAEKRAVAQLEGRLQSIRNANQGLPGIQDPYLTVSKPKSSFSAADSNSGESDSEYRSADGRSSVLNGKNVVIILKDFIREENEALRIQLKKQETVISRLAKEAEDAKERNGQMLQELEHMRSLILAGKLPIADHSRARQISSAAMRTPKSERKESPLPKPPPHPPKLSVQPENKSRRGRPPMVNARNIPHAFVP